MEIIETGIDGLVQIIPKTFQDPRGLFLEFFKSSKLKPITKGIEFLQDNISFSHKNVLRGLHLQLEPAAQAKLVTVVSGKVLDVVVDLRTGSPTFGKHYSLQLDGTIRNMLFIPVGFAHGFSALEESVFFYKCSQEYDPKYETGIVWNDPSLPIDWMVDSPILSEKDKHLPTFSELLEKSLISR
jgi:dTDP-4-dehydrorhamnose 3,5-epimerase